MKGNPRVVEQLKKLLACELSARDQYFIHSRIYDDMGLSKLYERMNHEMEEETEHADLLINRLLFLETIPDLNNQDEMKIGSDVPSMLQSDLDVEYAVGKALKDAMKICEEEKDFKTRDILLTLLDDTEMDHTWWLEKQLGLIDKIGLENYMQSQI